MKFVSVLVVISMICLSMSSIFASALTYYWQPELYENGTILSYGDTIERNVDSPYYINVVIRRISDGETEQGIYIRLKIVSTTNSTLFDRTVVTDNYLESNPEFYYSSFGFNEGAIPVGEHILSISATTTYGYYNSTYYLNVETGSKLEVPVPQSVTFLRNSIEANEEVDCVVIVNTNVTYTEFVNSDYAVSMVEVSGNRFEAAVLFQDSGDIEFIISFIDTYNFVYDYKYTVYVVDKTEEIYIPNIRVFDNGDETYTTVVKSTIWFDSSVYKELTTWHLIAEFNNNIIVDMTTAEPEIVQRNLWIYDYEREEIQVIVSGVTTGIGITYVFDDMGLKVSRVFSDIKIKGVNDWRNLWGLLGDSFIMNTEDKMIEGGIYNIDYVGSFGFFTAERTLVVRY